MKIMDVTLTRFTWDGIPPGHAMDRILWIPGDSRRWGCWLLSRTPHQQIPDMRSSAARIAAPSRRSQPYRWFEAPAHGAGSA